MERPMTSPDASVLNLAALQLVRGTEEDIPFIMATERLPGNEELVGRWSDARHRSALADGRHAYFIGRVESELAGFVIVRDWGSPEHVVHVKRLIVCHPGRGVGRALLAKLVERIFRETDAHRIWLGVFPSNARARRAYEAVGFQSEGIARGSAFFGGLHRDELVMSLLRPDWLSADSRRISNRT
jgi:RimJ/RimL family protein N-acetyltransferase